MKNLNIDNEIFKILTKVYKDELNRVDAIDQLKILFEIDQKGDIICENCGSNNIDKYGGDGIYCFNCHKQL